MLKKLIRPFLICAVLSAFLGACFHLLWHYSFFDGRTYFTVLVCMVLLFLLIWSAFLAERRELVRQRRAEEERQAEQQRLQDDALRETAELLNGGGADPNRNG